MYLNRSTILPFLLLTGIVFMGFTATIPDCTQLKKGRFHSYTKQGTHIIINRIDSIQQDINTKTRDTTYWKIEWLGNCRFAATYLSGGGPKSAEEKNVYLSTTLFYEVTELADNYYIGTTTVKAPNGTSSFADTTWLIERR